jgi:hypothetical protein
MLQQYPPVNLLTSNEVSDILMLLQDSLWGEYTPVIVLFILIKKI